MPQSGNPEDNMSLSQIIRSRFKNKIKKRKVSRVRGEVAKYIIRDPEDANKAEDF